MNYSINSLLTGLSVAYRRSFEKSLAGLGLHSGQAQVLTLLWLRDGLSQADIVRQLDVSPPTVNSLVSRLETEGFVRTRVSARDRRVKKIHLTRKAVSVREETEERIRRLEERCLRGLTDTEKVLVMMLLEKIRNNLQNDPVPTE